MGKEPWIDFITKLIVMTFFLSLLLGSFASLKAIWFVLFVWRF